MTTPRSIAFALLGAFLSGCGGGGGGGAGGGGTGTLALSATAGPFPATTGCLPAALITVDSVEVQSNGGWADTPLVGALDGEVTLDLLTLRSGLETSLAVGQLPTGTYGQIRLHIVDAVLKFVDGSPYVSFTVPSG